ncbi:MAG: DinB family protein [Blastocatellia bacterium]
MSEIKRISDQLKRAFEGTAWHGPSVMEVLADVTAEQAAAHPIPSAHSIWELVLHIQTWERIARRRVEEWLPIEVPDEEDWSPVGETTEHAWKNALNRLRLNHETLREVVARLDESRLSEIVPGTQYSVYFLLHGVIQHDLYHAGQIALLKKT